MDGLRLLALALHSLSIHEQLRPRTTYARALPSLSRFTLVVALLSLFTLRVSHGTVAIASTDE